jgi:diguanylate cyclase (GGDEF)-like protein
MEYLSNSCIRNTRQHIFSILRFAEKLSIPPSYEDIFKSSIELVFSIRQTKSASISLYSHVEKCLLDRVHKTSSDAHLHFIREPCTDPIALQAYEKGRVMQSEVQDPSAQDENPTYTKAYPMVSSELKLGVLTLVLDGEPIDDSAYTDELLQFISNICANSITQMRLMNMLRQQAETDNLTGAANRAFFHKTLAREFALVKRHGQSLSLLYLDVDNFKQYNDSKGHPAGDKRLSEIGKSLAESVRASDLVARIGGDEFAIIMPSTSKQQAAASAKRILKLAREGHGIVAAPGHKSPGYTLSIGIATCERGMLYKEDLIDAADRALLQAKRLGGNQSYTISIFEREERITGATNILHLP